MRIRNLLVASAIVGQFVGSVSSQELEDLVPFHPLETIEDDIRTVFLSCLSEGPSKDQAGCLSSAIQACNDFEVVYDHAAYKHSWRHCINNAVGVALEWVEVDLLGRGFETELVEEWFETTSAFCAVQYEFWMLTEDAPPLGIGWDASVQFCLTEHLFAVYQYL